MGGAGLTTSVYRLAFKAASQSKGLLTLRALKGDRTGLSTAGLGGTRRLGKVVGPVGGAERGYTLSGDAAAAAAAACLLEADRSAKAAGWWNLGSWSAVAAQVQLQSVAASLVLLAVVGALSRSTSALLLSPESSVLMVSALAVLLPVDVRFKGSFEGTKGAVSGGLATDGEAGLMDFRKSI